MRLAEMDVSDMLDVIHYFFEEDNRYSNADEPTYKDEFRQAFYKQVYLEDYKYFSNTGRDNKPYRDFDSSATSSLEDVPQEVIEPFNPRQRATSKSFIEPTIPTGDEATPFGSILDGPIG